jgi:hypothetical protein
VARVTTQHLKVNAEEYFTSNTFRPNTHKPEATVIATRHSSPCINAIACAGKGKWKQGARADGCKMGQGTCSEQRSSMACRPQIAGSSAIR